MGGFEVDKLTYTMPAPVIVARNRVRKLVLLGGLGVLGCGTMWVPESVEHQAVEGFEAMPERPVEEW